MIIVMVPFKHDTDFIIASSVPKTIVFMRQIRKFYSAIVEDFGKKPH